MRRQLTLLRHAKSSWDDTAVKDRNRPLNERGERDAPLMGRRLRDRGSRPTLIVTSPAVRARRTAQIIARDLIVCGHNPGLTELANRLTGAGIDNVPTAGLVVIELNLGQWSDLDGARGELLLFDYPRRTAHNP
jgi:phosphohistidine phosphatase